MPPRAAIVGSVDTTRILEPPVKNPVLAREACAEIGRELADAGWDIEVYSANTTFIEADVVHGYLSGDAAARPNSIHVRAPVGKSAFDEVRDYPEIFDFQPDPSRDWEVTFYRQLVRSDAVILIGGGRSTFVAGLIALAIGIPLLPLAGLGGAATKVWERLANEKGLAADEDIAEMAKEWTKYSAKRLIEGLARQRETRAALAREEAGLKRRQARRAHLSLGVASVLLLAVVAGIVAAWGWRPGTAGSITVLTLVPMFAAAAGALIRTSLDVGRDWARAGVLGGAVGLVSGLLYVASQLVGAPEILDSDDAAGVRRLLFFVLPIGFVAGLTFDAVYARLRGAEVSGVETLRKM